MMISKYALYVAACVCFFVAALPHGLPIRFEWLGAMFLTAAQL